MDKQQIIKKAAKRIQQKFHNEGSGHDWYHIQRVWKIAKYIAQKEKGSNTFVVEISALSHELGDYKLEPDLVDRQEYKVREFLKEFTIDKNLSQQIVDIVCNMSFSKNIGKSRYLSLEGKIVQDADRLEAIGAIGIARVFAYSGSKGNLIYDPQIKPNLAIKSALYKKSKSTAVNHFYEKLLLLKNKMNTKTAKKIAATRHKFMEAYLKEFYKEWEGKV